MLAAGRAATTSLPCTPSPCLLPALQGHENITYLQGAYEDKQAVHLVMDLCSGGELFDRCDAAGGSRELVAVAGRAAVEVRLLLQLAGSTGLPGVCPTCRWVRDQRGPCYVVVPAVANDAPPLTCPPRSIVATGSYSEKDAAQLIRDIVRVVAHCHSMGVIHRWGRGGAGQHALHPCKLPRAAQRPAARAALPCAAVAIQQLQLLALRSSYHMPPACQQPLCTSCLPHHGRRDLKPENFLLESKDPIAPIKCTDFGLSVFFKPGQKFKEVVGSGGRRWGAWARLGIAHDGSAGTQAGVPVCSRCR